MKKNYSATDAAVYLGVSRKRFYSIKEKYNLMPVEKFGNIKIYAEKDLDKIRKAMDKWLAAHGRLK